jgi:hypothetical protein
MFDTLALLVSDIFQGLGDPDDVWLGPEDVQRAAVHTLALYGLASQQSANSRTNSSILVYPNARDVPLSDMVGVMLPSYMERKVWVEPNETYVYCPAVRLAEIEEARSRGDDRCCIYKDELGFWRLRTSYDPNGITHRVWYYTDPVFAKVLNDPTGLPTRFGPMFIARAIVRVAPVMAMKMSKLPKEKRPDAVTFEALRSMVSENLNELEKKGGWEERYRYELNASREPRGRMRRSVLAGRRQY